MGEKKEERNDENMIQVSKIYIQFVFSFRQKNIFWSGRRKRIFLFPIFIVMGGIKKVEHSDFVKFYDNNDEDFLPCYY